MKYEFGQEKHLDNVEAGLLVSCLKNQGLEPLQCSSQIHSMFF
jgi:hypothetical protein